MCRYSAENNQCTSNPIIIQAIRQNQCLNMMHQGAPYAVRYSSTRKFVYSDHGCSPADLRATELLSRSCDRMPFAVTTSLTPIAASGGSSSGSDGYDMLGQLLSPPHSLVRKDLFQPSNKLPTSERKLDCSATAIHKHSSGCEPFCVTPMAVTYTTQCSASKSRLPSTLTI